MKFFHNNFILIFSTLIFISLPQAAESFENGRVTIEYYGETGCSHCDTFTSETVPYFENKYNIKIDVSGYDILDPDIYKKCEKLLKEKGYIFRYFPVLFIGNNIYQGETEIKGNLEEEIVYTVKNSSYRPVQKASTLSSESSTSGKVKSDSLVFNTAAITVLAAGLVDGINPCAFTVLLFFFSYLSLRRKSYNGFLKAGITFISAVFLTYILIGFGFYSLLSAIFDFGKIRFIIRISVTLMTMIFAFLSFADYFNIKNGMSGKIILKLPDSINKQIHIAVRSGLRESAFTAAVFLTGIIVSFMELACTGQIYLPSIVYILRTENFNSGLRLLLLYNTGFILPLCSVFIMLSTGIKSEKISLFFSRNMIYTKLLIALVFIILSVSVWLF